MTTLSCAGCGGRFDPDDDHVRVEAEMVGTDDRNDQEEYVLHIDCWDELTVDWIDPV